MHTFILLMIPIRLRQDIYIYIYTGYLQILLLLGITNSWERSHKLQSTVFIHGRPEKDMRLPASHSSNDWNPQQVCSCAYEVHEPEGSLAWFSVKAQETKSSGQAYGQRRRLPWAPSPSAYSAPDRSNTHATARPMLSQAVDTKAAQRHKPECQPDIGWRASARGEWVKGNLFALAGAHTCPGPRLALHIYCCRCRPRPQAPALNFFTTSVAWFLLPSVPPPPSHARPTIRRPRCACTTD